MRKAAMKKLQELADGETSSEEEEEEDDDDEEEQRDQKFPLKEASLKSRMIWSPYFRNNYQKS